jgi:hypothetical protein
MREGGGTGSLAMNSSFAGCQCKMQRLQQGRTYRCLQHQMRPCACPFPALWPTGQKGKEYRQNTLFSSGVSGRHKLWGGVSHFQPELGPCPRSLICLRVQGTGSFIIGLTPACSLLSSVRAGASFWFQGNRCSLDLYADISGVKEARVPNLVP